MIPLGYAAVSLIVGLVFPRLEHHYFERWFSTLSAPAAMAICSSIASGMISLTGIVFSLTFVMIQFSATAYSPRLVLWLARDAVVNHALGVFCATFIYALALLAWVDRNDSGHVPSLSGWLVLGLLLASIGMFIALIQRVELLRINRMLIFTGDQGRRAIADLYSPESMPGGGTEPADLNHLPLTQTVRHVGRPQAVQTIDPEALVELARATDAVIELAVAIGDTVVESSPLIRIHQARSPLDETRLRAAVTLGDERTFEQDPKYALRLVVDIAIKALSPAINDPTTAVQALDQIEDLLLRLGHHRLSIGTWHDAEGRLRLRAPFPTWDDFLLLALDEIRAYGADSVQVMRRMMALIQGLLSALPPARHPALLHWEGRLQASIARTFPDAEGQRDASVADRQGLGIGDDRPAVATPVPASAPQPLSPADQGKP